MSTVDCAIVGAGPAGLACAMQAVRQGLSIALFEKARPGGQALAANRIENYPGFAEGITGRELMERFVAQVVSHGIAIRREVVSSVTRPDALFEIETDLGRTESHALVVASGLRPRRLRVPGESDLENNRLFYYADPAEVPHEGAEIAIIGSGDAAFDQALSFGERASRVTIAMKYATPRCTPILAGRAAKAGIEVLPERNVVSLGEEDGGVRIGFADGKKLCADIAIVCIGKERDCSFIDGPLLCDGVPGIYFAGDYHRDRDRHISIAIGDGVASAMKAAEYIGASNARKASNASKD
jgi:thioredoxin reductase (NADPH)